MVCLSESLLHRGQEACPSKAWPLLFTKMVDAAKFQVFGSSYWPVSTTVGGVLGAPGRALRPLGRR